ncbi:MAG: RNA polymerase factor sigma-32 [Pseudomonadota bacterium]
MVKKSLPAIVDSLHRYLAEVKQYPYLSREAESKLAKQYYDGGDLDAAQKLVLSNLRLVVKIAHEYSKTGHRLMDLIQEGNIGLMKAVKDFNPYKGVRLSTYAQWWIKAYIHNYLMKNFSLVKIGTTQNQRKLFYKLSQEKKRLEALGLESSIKLLANNLDVKEAEIQEMEIRLASKDISLDTPVSDDESISLLDLQSDKKTDIEKEVSKDEVNEKFNEKLAEFSKTLNNKALYIYKNRMLAEEPMTLQEIADKYSITRERVRQIEANILKKLKKFIGNEVEEYR